VEIPDKSGQAGLDGPGADKISKPDTLNHSLHDDIGCDSHDRADRIVNIR
jgi:hypothetical protein